MNSVRASTPAVRRRMQAVKRRDTPKEIQVRKALHRTGLRYRVDYRPCPGVNCRADIVFVRERIAIFVDGCFWHGCRRHGTLPKATNRQFWQTKIADNRQRDRKIKKRLEAAGWRVLRFWEHEDTSTVVAVVLDSLRS
jgi:DNA mismatch endonuclease (patch repair protein)